jgi:hypothetical protein
MLLKDAIAQHHNVARLLEVMSTPLKPRTHHDDVNVRPYVVRRHWRRRPRYKLRVIVRKRTA